MDQPENRQIGRANRPPRTTGGSAMALQSQDPTQDARRQDANRAGQANTGDVHKNIKDTLGPGCAGRPEWCVVLYRPTV
jgi:hypothetical protein